MKAYSLVFLIKSGVSLRRRDREKLKDYKVIGVTKGETKDK